jgi:hypothetical protein
MVSVYFGIDRKSILNVDEYFNHTYEDEWLDDPLVKEMVKDIDNSDILSRYCIQSPVLGQIPPTMLSGGVKTLIMLYKGEEGFVPDLIVCGENCQKWLSKIFSLRGIIKVTMSGYDLNFNGLPIEGICENDGSKIKDSKDWTKKMLDMVGEEGNER